MVVKEDGSKWACQSCLKGHRVSGCTHVDRELTLVPKKGRPVTQCQHCRQERKKRSAHVSCDCGQPDKQHHAKEKCIHLREAEEKAKTAGYHPEDAGDKDSAHLARIAEEQGCCCGHGGKCTCALMRNDMDDGCAPHGPAVKPKLEKTISEGSITKFQNGHHKPVHRKNHAAHECGAPYKMMPRHSADNGVSVAARRSVDSLALDTNQAGQPSGFIPPSAAPFSHERRQSKSEQPSPKIFPLGGGCNGMFDAKISGVDFSMLSQTVTNQSVQSTTSESFGMPSFDPMSGIADNSFDPWSAYPSADSMTMPNNNPFTVWPTSNDNVTMGQPALTAASSGTTSEIDEIPNVDESFDFMPSIQEDPNIDFSNFVTGGSPQMNRRSLPPGFFGNTDFAAEPAGGEWALPPSNYDASSANKIQPPLNRQPASFDQTWQMPDARPPMNMAQRQLGGLPNGLPNGQRPQSRSVGPSSAPSDDIIKQLFPDIDINGSMFAGSPSFSQLGLPKDFTGMTPTSAPLEYGPMDETSNGFASHPWSHGSMTIPSDVVTSSYNGFDQDFSNPDFTSNWSQ